MQQDKTSGIVSAIILAGVLIAGAILLKDSSPSPETVKTPPKTADSINKDLVTPINEKDHILGNTNARVVILEYSDTECPFCKSFHNTMNQVMKIKGSEIAWVYRHYPIPQLHARAPYQAEATECAASLGGNTAFWKYIDKVFEATKSNNGLEDSKLLDIAEDIGLNSSSFYTCLESGKFANEVEIDTKDGQAMGVNGTPHSFIVKDGKVIDEIKGAQKLETVISQIESALSQ